MELERQKKESSKTQKDGGIWKSGNKSKQIKGYGEAVLNQHKKEMTKKINKGPKNNSSAIVDKENRIIKDVTKTLNQFNPAMNKIEMDESNNDCKDVVEFLESVKLIKYKDTFIQNGFEDMDSILELNDEYLESLGVPLGHKLKIMKRIKELRNDSESTQESRPATVPVTQSNYIEGASCSTDDLGNNEEEKNQIAYKNMNYSQINFANNKFEGNADSVNNEYQPDMCGFEVASHHHTQSSSRADGQTEIIKKKVKSSDVGTDTMTNSKKIGVRDSCWQCYKLEIKNLMVSDEQISDKLFCTLTCLQKYKQNNPMLIGSNSISKCGNENCQNTFLKTKKGMIVGNKWYCSEICIPEYLPEEDGEYINEEGEYNEEEGDIESSQNMYEDNTEKIPEECGTQEYYQNKYNQPPDNNDNDDF